jgi:hypothetical protein
MPNRSADGENGRRQPTSDTVPLADRIRSSGAKLVISAILAQHNEIQRERRVWVVDFVCKRYATF